MFCVGGFGFGFFGVCVRNCGDFGVECGGDFNFYLI